MATSAQDIVTLSRPLIGDIRSRSSDPESDLVWEDAQLAAMMPAGMNLTVGHWTQEYSCGTSLTDEVSPDPAAHNDIGIVPIFLAKAVLMAEQARWARRAVIHSGVAGSTNMRGVAEALGATIERLDGMIEEAYNRRMHEAVAADMVIREAKTETGDDTEAWRPAAVLVVKP